MATQVSLNDGAVASAGALAIQTNGTTQAVSISTGQVATLAQNPILTSGTANGVAYLNGSKAVTSGSALVFDGTNLGVGTSSPADKLEVISTITARASSGTSALRLRNTTTDMQWQSVAGTNAVSLFDSGAGLTRLTVDSAGNVTLQKNISVGGATVTTSGTGITFPVTQSASSDANTLDDYEEGTLTTSFSSPVNLTGTPALGKGRYTKVGRLVSIQGEITGYSITTANTLTYFVMTLPFVTVGNTEAFSGSVTETGSYSVGTILDSSSGSDNTIFLGFRAASVPSSGTAQYHFSLTYMSA